MNTKNESAFPRAKQILGSGEDYHEIPVQEGLSKRELVAAMVLQGLCANRWSMESGNYTGIDLAQMAVSRADALLVELAK